MPVRTGVGANKYSTPIKQASLDVLMGHLLATTCAAAANMHPMPAFVLDMTSGPGVYEDGSIGSPLIIARHIRTLRKRGYHLEMVCCDRHAPHIASLRAHMAERYPDVPVRYEISQRDALAGLPLRLVGLAYFDFNSYTHMDAELLFRMNHRYSMLDVLFTAACLNGKRQLYAPQLRGRVLSIRDYLIATGKRHRYFAQFARWDWWSFGFADNWDKRPAHTRMFHGNELVPDDSPAGKALYAKWIGEEPAVGKRRYAIRMEEERESWEQSTLWEPGV